MVRAKRWFPFQKSAFIHSTVLTRFTSVADREEEQNYRACIVRVARKQLQNKEINYILIYTRRLCFAVERVWQMSNSCYTIPTTINTTKLILCVSVITVGHFCGPLVQLKRQLIAAIGKTNKYGRADKTEPH